MQRTLQILTPNDYWDAIHEILWQKIVKKNTCPLQKSEFLIVFAKNPSVENFRLRKKSARVNYGAANAT